NMNTLRNPDIEKRIAALLQRMTLDEKIGQMTQLTLGVLGGKFEPDERPDMTIPQERLDDVIARHKVGSVLNVADTALRRSNGTALCRSCRRLRYKPPAYPASTVWT
ncbi:MAG: hypothetical protein K2I19_00260, partial [Muribaculaceae bacterium]|nr:hypothetical protein [Muribaculaceae bacterium]